MNSARMKLRTRNSQWLCKASDMQRREVVNIHIRDRTNRKINVSVSRGKLTFAVILIASGILMITKPVYRKKEEVSDDEYELCPYFIERGS